MRIALIAAAIAVNVASTIACCFPAPQQPAPQQVVQAPTAPEPKPSQQNKPLDLTPPSVVPETSPKKAEPKSAIPVPTPEKIAWADATKESAIIGDLEVGITGVRLGKPRILTLIGNREGVLKEDRLIVQLWIKNRSETKKIDGVGWNRSSLIGSNPKLLDEFDNSYYASGGTSWSSIDGTKVLLGSLYPGKVMPDALIFQLPVDKAKTLRMELPAPSPMKGHFRFTFPISVAKRD